MLVDLHMHSTCSDGILEPAPTIRWALEHGAEIVSLTDHDSVEGTAEARAAVKEWNSSENFFGHSSPAFITGVELSCMYESRLTHLLGYGFQIDYEPLVSLLGRISVLRVDRAHRIMKLLNRMGVPLTFDEAFGHDAPKLIGRAHIARAMVEHGHLDSIDKAFNSFLGDDRGAFVPIDEITIEEGISMLHSAGGLAVLAHPRGICHTQFMTLREMGLDGVECFHSRVPDWQRENIQKSAEILGLFMTGGSDFHGPPAEGSYYSPVCPDLADPAVLLEPILALKTAMPCPAVTSGG